MLIASRQLLFTVTTRVSKSIQQAGVTEYHNLVMIPSSTLILVNNFNTYVIATPQGRDFLWPEL